MKLKRKWAINKLFVSKYINKDLTYLNILLTTNNDIKSIFNYFLYRNSSNLI